MARKTTEDEWDDDEPSWEHMEDMEEREEYGVELCMECDREFVPDYPDCRLCPDCEESLEDDE